jgi:hypothetical protein
MALASRGPPQDATANGERAEHGCNARHDHPQWTGEGGVERVEHRSSELEVYDSKGRLPRPRLHPELPPPPERHRLANPGPQPDRELGHEAAAARRLDEARPDGLAGGDLVGSSWQTTSATAAGTMSTSSPR